MRIIWMILKWLCVGLIWIVGLLPHLWSFGALYYRGFRDNTPLFILSIAVYVLITLGLILKVHHRFKSLVVSYLSFVLVVLWFNAIKPDPQAVYPEDLIAPRVEIQDNLVTVHNVRNNDYRSVDDFDIHYETRTYDLDQIQTMDIFFNYWGMPLIAHTLLSFGFSDGQYLAVSVEIRPEIGEKYGMLKGFFKEYELIYIWADEKDLVKLRTNYRKEEAYLYRTSFTPHEVRLYFLSMLNSTDDLYTTPEFYNTLTANCTNILGTHINDALGKGRRIPFWERRALSGKVEKVAYDHGFFVRSKPSFDELRKSANIVERALAVDQGSGFSERIRTHL